VLPALAVGGPGGASAATGPGAATLPDATPLQVTLSLKPRHPRLLERLAEAASARPPLAPQVVRELFLPGPADVARVRSAMAAAGLRLVAHDALSLTFAGTAGAAERAFGVSLAPARAADGSPARSAAGRPQVPAAVAPLVQDVSGLDTQAQLRPAGSGAVSPAAVPCSGATHSGGYLPSQLGSAGGYDFSSLVSGGYSGGGERVAVVAFSSYKPSDVAAYQSCFGTSVPVTDHAVSGGTSDRSGSDEVSLDVETVISAAPGLDALHVYIARPTGTMAQVVNAIVSDAPSTGVRIVTDSWGICEPALSPARAAATNDALQLAAVSGITFLAASGDSGSFDCGGFGQLAVDDPAAQQFATGVGGTNLRLGTAGSRHEVVWNDFSGAGGGGLSRFWTRPSWQAGAGVHSRFSNGNREVPDVSLHASPQQHGYPIYCTTGVCGGAGWQTVGGTSAGAPLLAGIVADMNQYSRAHGGHRLGFANPFLYDRLIHDPAAFRDVTRGNNNLDGIGRYPATSGYDMATGIGAPLAVDLAADLAAYTPSAPAFVTTSISARPSRDRTIRYGRSVRLRGTLMGGGGALAGQTIYVQGGTSAGIREWRVRTDGQGRWSLTLHHQLTRKTRWRAVFLGSQHRTPAVSRRHTIYVRPPLTASVKHSSVSAGRSFRLHGRTFPALAGRPVAAEVRRAGGRWHRVGPAGVRYSGHFGRSITIHRAGQFQVRWHYHGSRRGNWMSSVSPPVAIRVR
jgi:subtilase family serine protease